MYASNLTAEIVRYSDTLLLLSGEFDLTTDVLLERALADWARDGGPMTLEMSSVTFIDSAAINALLRSLGRAPSGCLILHGVSRFVAKTFQLIGADSIAGLHVNPCSDRDPYPEGRLLARDVEGRDVLARLTRMRAEHARSRLMVRRNTDATDDVRARARAVRAAARLTRERVAA